MVSVKSGRFATGKTQRLYYSKNIVDKFSRYFYTFVSKFPSVSGSGDHPVHKEVYMYAIAYEQDSFGCMLDYSLQRERIGKDPSFDIMATRTGTLRLATNHPRRNVIESILNEDRSLFDTYRRIEDYYTRIALIAGSSGKLNREFLIKVSNEGYRIRVK